jgi:hypothetical protein
MPHPHGLPAASARTLSCRALCGCVATQTAASTPAAAPHATSMGHAWGRDRAGKHGAPSPYCIAQQHATLAGLYTPSRPPAPPPGPQILPHRRGQVLAARRGIPHRPPQERPHTGRRLIARSYGALPAVLARPRAAETPSRRGGALTRFRRAKRAPRRAVTASRAPVQG